MALTATAVATDKGNTVEFKSPVKTKRKYDAHHFKGAIELLKERRAEKLLELYNGFRKAFTDVEDGGEGKTVHMVYLANDGNMVDALVKKLKAEKFIPDVFVSKGRKIVTVDLALQ